MLLTDQPVHLANLSKKEKKQLLKQTEIFNGFTDRELDDLSSLVVMSHYPAEYEIFVEGSTGAEMYIIITGKVCLTIDLGASEWTKTIVLSSNTFFGEMSLLDDRPRSAGAVMCAEGILVSLDKNTFRKLIKKFPKFTINIMTTLCDRLRKVNDLVLQLGQHIART